jgi:hypothetical protein
MARRSFPTLDVNKTMGYRFAPFLFRDVSRVLSDAAESPQLRERIARQPVSGRWWVLDESSISYLFSLDGELMEGPGYLLRFGNDFFEVKAEPFGNRVAFREGLKPATDEDKVQTAFSAAIRVYGRNGEGPMRPDDIPLEPVFVGAL